MTYDEFMDKIEELNEDTDAVDIYCSEDFQCDQTGGFPTMLCVNWDKGKAWLQLNDFLITDGIDVSGSQQRCVDFGIRDCSDVEDFNNILKSLGEDAERTAYLPDDYDADEGQGMKL